MHVIDSSRGRGVETSIVETMPSLETRDIETSIVTLFDDGTLDGWLAELDVNRIRQRAMGRSSNLLAK